MNRWRRHGRLARLQAESPQSQSTRDSQPKTLLEVQPERQPKVDQLRSFIRSAAAIYYHRSLALAALDRQTEAEAERAKVKQLIGREPDETLF